MKVKKVRIILTSFILYLHYFFFAKFSLPKTLHLSYTNKDITLLRSLG